jgi:hypothetical protein
MSELHAALAKAQAEFPTLPKDATNPHYKSKFTPLDTIVEKVGPILAKHGLAWSALPTISENGEPALRYRLMHSSGEVLEDTMPLLLVKKDSQGLGASLTYARRYALTAVLNLVADEDDDGQRAVAGPAPTQSLGIVLDDASVQEVITSLQKTSPDAEAVRTKLVELGVSNVPAGPLRKSTIQAMTSRQALLLVQWLEGLVDA